MSYENSSKTHELNEMRKNAKQGDFFFANFLSVTGNIRKSPVFVVGNDNDNEDIIICSCTGQPPKTEFDKKVNLKKETYVRTNKIYTVRRDQLLFKIPQQTTPKEFKEIMDSLRKIFNL